MVNLAFSPRTVLAALLLALVPVMLAQRSVFCRPTTISSEPDGFYSIKFPDKGKIGEVLLIDDGDDYVHKHAPGKIFAKANGLVRVPRGAHIGFRCTDVMGLQKPMEILDAIPADALTCVVLTNTIFDEKQLHKLCRFPNLKRVELSGTEVTDSSVSTLSALPQLETLVVSRTRVNGQFLLDFARHKNLRQLNLSHNEIEHKYWLELKKFPRLSQLILSSLHLNDSDLAAISGCIPVDFLDITNNLELTTNCVEELKHLKLLSTLEIPYTKLTARDILQLKGLPLNTLRLQPTQGSEADMEALKKQFPHLQIHLETAKEQNFKTYRELFD
jgi:hypothetical protein